MPDIYAHILCAEDAIARVKNKDARQILIDEIDSYRLGAQGPDFFYYYNILPWKDDKGFPQIGNVAHSENIDSFFTNAAKIIKEQSPSGAFKRDSQGKIIPSVDFSAQSSRIKFAYLAGFLSHHALDSRAHPYIFYVSGIDSGCNHKFFEASIDTILMKYRGARNSSELIRPERGTKEIIAALIYQNMKDVFGIKISIADVLKAFEDFASTVNLLYDPFKIKRLPFGVLDKALGLKGFAASSGTPAKLKAGVDYLNLRKKTWIYPADEGIKSDDSFLDIIIKATNASAELADLLYSDLLGENADFKKNLSKNSYDTGLEGKRKMQHENIIVHWTELY